MTELAAAVRTNITKSSRASRIWYGTLGVFVVLGLYAFVRQESEGHYLTNLTNLSPWGLYIAGFVFFVGASAGSTIVGLMVHAFGRKEYAPLATRAILVGLLTLTAAVALIMLDVGRIDRAVLMPWLHRNPTSMFFYTALSYQVFGLILAAELWYTIKITRGVSTKRDDRIGKWLAIAAVPFALVVLHAPHGALFAVIKAREFWNSPLLPPHFAVVALVSGTALMLIVAVVSSWLKGRELVSRKVLTQMGSLLALFIAVAAFMDFFDFLVFRYSDLAAGNEAWQLLTGPLLPFSIIHLGGYAAALAILLSSRRRQEVRWLTAAAAITLVGVAAYRYNLVIVGMGVPLLPFFDRPLYWPSGIEILMTLGVIAAGLLAYSLLVRVIPMEEDAGSAAAPEPEPAGAKGATWTPPPATGQPAR